MTGSGRRRRFYSDIPFRALALVALAVILFSGGLACTGKKSAQDQIQELVDSASKAAEEKRPGGLVIHLTEDFHDNHGNDKQTVKAVLLREMMNNNKLSVYVTTSDIEVTGGEASALVKVIVTGSAGWIPEHMDHVRIELKLRRESDKWMIYYADWKPASEQQ